MVPLLKTLSKRFDDHPDRHSDIQWQNVAARLESSPGKVSVLEWMEETGGEPDVIGMTAIGEAIFCDCSRESPSGRRSLCYDRQALEARKEHKPAGSAMEEALSRGARLLSEDEYSELQKLGPFDLKTSSWLATPDDVRKLGGALFGDHRYERTFIYHNGAQSYYASRGFRVILEI